MKDFYKKEAVQVVKAMLKAFFVDKNVENVLKFVNPNNFTWIGPGENEILTDIDDVRKHFEAHCNKAACAYQIISEEFIAKNFSSDSCIVIAKLKFQGLNERKNYESALHFSFYLQLIDEKFTVSHYHVHIPNKKKPFNYLQYFTMNNRADNPHESLQIDAHYQESLLQQFFFGEQTAMKSFFYEDGLPYCYVNQPFLKLVGFKDLKSFMSREKVSSLAHIHPEDQQRYLNHLKSCFPEPVTLDLQEWKWHASYNIIYRTQTFDKREKFVFEWGNLFSMNGRLIVNCFVLPSGNNFYPQKPVESSLGDSLLDDVGVRIGNLIVIYPKRQKLFIKDSLVNLTPIEFKLLMILSEEINSPVASDKIYNSLWNSSDLKITSFTLKTHMSNLRKKLKDASDGAIKLIYLKKAGYCLSTPKF